MHKTFPWDKLRAYLRKHMKPELKKMVDTYHKQKIEAFYAQRVCFKTAFRMLASLQCAAMVPVPSGDSYLVSNATHTTMFVSKYSMWSYQSECWNSTNRMIKLGNGFEEVQAQIFATERYPFWKNEMKKWMNMLDSLAESDMTFDGILKNTFNKMFAKGGLFDSFMSFAKAETENSLTWTNKHQVWDMNLKKPSSFSYSEIDKFVTPDGVSDELATLNWCKPATSKNATLNDLNEDLDYF